MSKAYRSQNVFFALGVLCTLTVFNGNRFYALSRAKACVQEIDRKNRDDRPVAIGYAAQEIKRIFVQEGVTQAVIRLGDTVVNIGHTRRIGIRNPLSGSNENFAYLEISEKAMVTLYQNDYSDKEFIRESDLASVTLIGNDALLLSKVCYTLIGYSLKDAYALLYGTEYVAILVSQDGQVRVTGGLSQEQQTAAA